MEAGIDNKFVDLLVLLQKNVAQIQHLSAIGIQAQGPGMLGDAFQIVRILQLLEDVLVERNALEPGHLALLPVQQQQIVGREGLPWVPREALQDVFGQEFQNHAHGEVGLLQLVPLLLDLGQVDVQAADVVQADVARVQEGAQVEIGGAAHVQRHLAVQVAHRDLVQLLAREAEALEVRRAEDLFRVPIRQHTLSAAMRRGVRGLQAVCGLACPPASSTHIVDYHSPYLNRQTGGLGQHLAGLRRLLPFRAKAKEEVAKRESA